jgi:hypothetical protein
VPRYAKRTDANQAAIVKALRDIPGVTVAVDHDDILCGRNGVTFWFEVKRPETVSKKEGAVCSSQLKKSQKKLMANWTGHYSVVWSIEQILEEIGVKR